MSFCEERDARGRAYSPSLWARDFEATLDRQAERGACLRARHQPRRLAYGAHALEGLNLFLPENQGPWPLMVFLHGGYWQQLDAMATDFMAESWLSRGWAFASLDYPLAPEVNIETMVAACQQGVRYLQREASTLGLNGRIYLGGHSAGAQLAIMSCLGNGRLEGIEALWLISGIYDLRPLAGTYIDEPLQLDGAQAERLSPLCHDLQGLPPLMLVHGEFDPPSFRSQGEALYERALAAGVAAELCPMPNCDHFDILERLEALPF
ncbi:alpha/beta hydrolase [Vreelandella alkaliphila]|uniref:alpha/beta hydrolase n=1 Tax=Vreelandella alkaliphila TaxID=272774 RepID=UPI000EA19872|nr:alpha/beta hydrolase [Halomonas alkaliphila]AYF33000.1 alpha/beta hydrolase [Halomonas alkaliphila]